MLLNQEVNSLPAPPTNQPSTLKTDPSGIEVTPKLTPIVPTSLKLLLALIITQALLAIGVLVCKIVFGFIGWDQKVVVTVDQTNCPNYQYLQAYQSKQLTIIKVALVAICASLLLTLIILGIVAKVIHNARTLPTYMQAARGAQVTLSLPCLHLVVGPKTRALLYILQSLSLLDLIIVLGYYLTYFVKFQLGQCSWIDTTTNTVLPINTKIIIIWAICAGAFLCAWFVWAIIVIINIKNRDTYLQDNAKEEYSKLQNNTVVTEMNNTNVNEQKYIDNTKPSHDPLLINQYQYDEPIKKTRTNDSEKPQIHQYSTNNLKNSSAQKQNPYVISYVSPVQPDSKKFERYQNPVFQNRNQLYNSPISRINQSKYYEGDQPKNNIAQKPIQMQMSPVKDTEKDKEFKRSRFSSNKYENYTRPEQTDDLKHLYRHRVQQDEQFKPRQSRQILPQSNYGSPKQGIPFEGAKPKLHTTYFRDQASMLHKKKYENSDKKKRKGILDDYIHGRYAD